MHSRMRAPCDLCISECGALQRRCWVEQLCCAVAACVEAGNGARETPTPGVPASDVGGDAGMPPHIGGATGGFRRIPSYDAGVDGATRVPIAAPARRGRTGTAGTDRVEGSPDPDAPAVGPAAPHEEGWVCVSSDDVASQAASAPVPDAAPAASAPRVRRLLGLLRGGNSAPLPPPLPPPKRSGGRGVGVRTPTPTSGTDGSIRGRARTQSLASRADDAASVSGPDGGRVPLCILRIILLYILFLSALCISRIVRAREIFMRCAGVSDAMAPIGVVAASADAAVVAALEAFAALAVDAAMSGDATGCEFFAVVLSLVGVHCAEEVAAGVVKATALAVATAVTARRRAWLSEGVSRDAGAASGIAGLAACVQHACVRSAAAVDARGIDPIREASVPGGSGSGGAVSADPRARPPLPAQAVSRSPVPAQAVSDAMDDAAHALLGAFDGVLDASAAAYAGSTAGSVRSRTRKCISRMGRPIRHMHFPYGPPHSPYAFPVWAAPFAMCAAVFFSHCFVAAGVGANMNSPIGLRDMGCVFNAAKRWSSRDWGRRYGL